MNVKRERRRLLRARFVCTNGYKMKKMLLFCCVHKTTQFIQNYTYLLFCVRVAKQHWQRTRTSSKHRQRHQHQLMAFCLYKYYFFSSVRCARCSFGPPFIRSFIFHLHIYRWCLRLSYDVITINEGTTDMFVRQQKKNKI